MNCQCHRGSFATLVGALALLWLTEASAAENALEEYVRRPDPASGWTLQSHSWGLLADVYKLRLVSQQWQDAAAVDHPRWIHELSVVQPRAICGKTARTSSLAVLFISGGRNDPDGEPRHSRRDSSTLAGLTGQTFCRPVMELRQVPNQPLRFAGESEGRFEDAVIAYSMDRYLREEPGDWPVQLAMVKSVAQAMDAVQAFSRTREDIPDIDSFVLIGASKRGWTAWLTAAVDPRVRAIVPASIDMPNMAEQFPHHLGSYGDYAPALADYKALDIACRMTGPRGATLLGIVDPYTWRERLRLPKLILNSAGDEFFVSDSSRFYYDQLLGDNRLRYTVNTDHDQGDKWDRYRLFLMARTWIDDLVAGRTPPRLDWQRPSPELLVVRPSVPAREVRLWTAHNPRARDFRLETIGPAWQATPLQADPDGAYRVKLRPPPEGWQALLVEAVFGGDDTGRQQTYTTGVYVLPDSLPHAGAACAGIDAAKYSPTPARAPN